MFGMLFAFNKSYNNTQIIILPFALITNT